MSVRRYSRSRISLGRTHAAGAAEGNRAAAQLRLCEVSPSAGTPSNTHRVTTCGTHTHVRCTRRSGSDLIAHLAPRGGRRGGRRVGGCASRLGGRRRRAVACRRGRLGRGGRRAKRTQRASGALSRPRTRRGWSRRAARRVLRRGRAGLRSVDGGLPADRALRREH